ncbi:MAG: MBL fold metallo-hydrolase [Rickettsiales bacterium]|jgi:glyoxylase-like metal-dependent hydrolase (beta-lactamase superfamily II)|nr:MBL fold metallo-hydrolase [Rickettsiales bacterium]
MPDVKFEVMQMPPKNTNSILASFGNDCVIFDAWGRADDWARFLSDSHLNLRAIYSTHGHYDHISAAAGLAERYDAPWHLNHRDLFMIPWGNAALARLGLPPIPEKHKQPLDLAHGVIEVFPGILMGVIETPGHSAGGVAFHFPGQHVLIIGDTLFQNSVGRYDLPGSDRNALMNSISRIYNMNFPDDTIVLHGHGADTTISVQKAENPYFKNHNEQSGNFPVPF